jgi:hypothetical protein
MHETHLNPPSERTSNGAVNVESVLPVPASAREEQRLSGGLDQEASA